MSKRKKKIPAKKSKTFDGVPYEYDQLIEDMVDSLKRGWLKLKFTEPKATPDMTRSQLRTLVLCELFHEKSEEIYGDGSTEKNLERYRQSRKLRNEPFTPNYDT